jgi:polygalacturonase
MGHGLAIGSEMSGGVENVQVWDCQMEASRCGFEIKGSKERGGYVKNVSVYNSSFSILAIRSVKYNCDGVSAEMPPVFENYHFENITLTGVCRKHTGETWDEAVIITEGFDVNGCALKNVTIKNVKIKHREHNPTHVIRIASITGVNLENIVCE